MTRIYKATKKYEGRTTETAYCWDIETAKESARNWVRLHEPPEWVDESEEWENHVSKLVLENGPSDSEVKIKSKVLRGYDGENDE